MVEPPQVLKGPMHIPHKLLLGPGPSNMPPEVVKALNEPLLGYLHPEFLQIMNEVKAGIQYAFQTKNRMTMAVSGTGHSGMESAMVNLIEPGDTVLIAENGIWGQRAAEIADRCRAKVEKIVLAPGNAFELKTIEEALTKYKPSLLFVCHGESSCGVLQPLEKIGSFCHQNDCLLLVDTVASLGAAPFNMDELEVDCAYSATQKALSCPPGLAPISFSDRAWQKVTNRKTKIQSFYMDMPLIANYWGCTDEPPRYHHTGPMTTVYALRAALTLMANEGVENSIKRHQQSSLTLQEGVKKLGLKMFVKDQKFRAPTINTIEVPDGIDWKAVVDYLMSKYKIEIAGGLGPTLGKIWRIGLMGHNSNEETVKKVLSAFEQALNQQKKS